MPARAHAFGELAVGCAAAEEDAIAPVAFARVGGEAHAGLAAEIGQGQRQAAGGGQVERLVALAPVFDESDVGARAGGNGFWQRRISHGQGW
jgi:hypothetical protein